MVIRHDQYLHITIDIYTTQTISVLDNQYRYYTIDVCITYMNSYIYYVLSVAILVQIITGTRFTPFYRIDTDHHAVVGDSPEPLDVPGP